MPLLRYLDTARLGPMTSAAQEAQHDFVRLSGEEPSSLYFEEFLRDGFHAWPTSYQRRFPGLLTWTGIAGLKRSLLKVAAAPMDWGVLLAQRSLTLVNLAARCQFQLCRNVLTTDLSWPTYQAALEHRATATENQITRVAIREQILRHGWSVDDVVEYLAAAFAVNRCDGLFLPAVDHLGIQLPIAHIVRRMEEFAALRFVFIDAAQAFCQVSIMECFDCADFVVAGAHKWLGAYLPMGIGYFGRDRSRDLLERDSQHLRRTSTSNDPLLDFTEHLQSDDLDTHLETANLTSMFAAAAAVSQGASHAIRSEDSVALPVEDEIDSVTRPSPKWQPLRPAETFQTRIVLFNRDPATARHSAADIRREWLDAGSIVTAYADELVRVSLPHKP